MEVALRTQAKVLACNRVEIPFPELREGDTVEVIVVLPDHNRCEQRSAIDIIESLRGHRMFATSTEVDRHLNEERDSWDR